MGVGPLPRPPRGATPDQFFTSYVPALHGALSAELPGVPRPIRLGLAIQGGPSFTFIFEGPRLSLASGLAADCLLRASVSLSDWREHVTHVLPKALSLFEQQRARASAGMAEFLSRVLPTLDLASLAASGAHIDLRLEDDAGDVTHVTLFLGAGGGPKIRVGLALPDLFDFAERGGRLGKLLQTRARLEGDVALLLRLLAQLALPTTSAGGGADPLA